MSKSLIMLTYTPMYAEIDDIIAIIQNTWRSVHSYNRYIHCTSKRSTTVVLHDTCMVGTHMYVL